MNWDSYKTHFIEKARLANFSSSNIVACLQYAKRLYDNKVPIIYDLNHFSLLVGYDKEYLIRASNGQKYFYRTFAISKKNGRKRKISEPLPNLKTIQRWMLDHILSTIEISRFAKAYIKKRSIRDNARFHLKQKYVLNLDIQNFFSSIDFNRVYRLFRDLGYRKSLSVLFANLCILDGSLPQGAPTSPAISNIIFRRNDARISGYCIANKIRYTRYADDMTFSGDFECGKLIHFIKRVLRESGFKLNTEKTRFMGRHQRQEVTGIVVNEKMQLPRNIRRDLRQKRYYIEKYGLDSYLKHQNIKYANHIGHIIGKTSFGLFLNRSDKELSENLEFFRDF